MERRYEFKLEESRGQAKDLSVADKAILCGLITQKLQHQGIRLYAGPRNVWRYNNLLRLLLFDAVQGWLFDECLKWLDGRPMGDISHSLHSADLRHFQQLALKAQIHTVGTYADLDMGRHLPLHNVLLARQLSKLLTDLVRRLWGAPFTHLLPGYYVLYWYLLRSWLRLWGL